MMQWKCCLHPNFFRFYWILCEKCISLKVAHRRKSVTTIDIDLECFLTCIIYYKYSFWHPSFLYVDPSLLCLLNMKNLTHGNIFSHVTKEYPIYVDNIFKNILSNSLVHVHIHVLAIYPSPSHSVVLLVYVTPHEK
jgi:hypothetical protein